MVEVDVDIRPSLHDEVDSSEYPTFENFMPPDAFRNIVEQKPPEMSEISVAFLLSYNWQKLEETVKYDAAKRFIANPPPCSVPYDEMTAIQRWAVDVGCDPSQQILYLCGKAGSGKTTCALKICEKFAGKVQAGACTGKAASLFRGPTLHSMFGWSHNEDSSRLTEVKPDSWKMKDLFSFYDGIEVFVIDEVNAMPAATLALLDQTMTAIFNPKHTKTGSEMLPFGGKKMIFLGDPAQLRPIAGAAIYNDGICEKSQKSKHSVRSKSGQYLYKKYLEPNCIILQQGQRNSGLLAEICDRMRDGQLTEDDCVKLTYQRTKFPGLQTDFGIHYENDCCSMHNWRQLWTECSSTEDRRMFLCKATYHVTANNQEVVDTLSVLPAKAYKFAPDILCVALGCEVRLVKNINVSAGLVNSVTGTVVKVIYDNADVQILIDRNHPPPYCIVVKFPTFHGFVDKKDKNQRIFPFSNQRHWVPIYRQKFEVSVKHLPAWVRKKQEQKHCYRVQFPLDLASNITAHRAQGQTMSGNLVSVDLGLESPDKRQPPEIGLLLYVACSRVESLENLFVSSIYPSVWKSIGKSELDNHRRTVEDRLRQAAEEFAVKYGMLKEVKEELSWKADYRNNETEWQTLQQKSQPPQSRREMHTSQVDGMSTSDLQVSVSDIQFQMVTSPVLSERHIGIDQGENNFGKSTDVLLALKNKTDLLMWMNAGYSDCPVDRVVVHLEQMDARNKHSKQFNINLGRLLQRQVADAETCIVKLSQPHIHRAGGPLFRLGDKIIEDLHLRPALYLPRRSQAEKSLPTVTRRNDEEQDVEPSDDKLQQTTELTDQATDEYHFKKKMSANVFRYIIEADEDQLKEMQISIDCHVQSCWRERLRQDSKVKLDDVGDALLHALNEVLCGSTNFKQLVPAVPSVHVNRTIGIAVFPSTTYWVVLQSNWNLFVFENFGWFDSNLYGRFYKDESTVLHIMDCVNRQTELRAALDNFNGNATYGLVSHIKVVVKQLTGHTDLGLKSTEAGALTDSTVRAMKRICDSVMGPNSKLPERHDKILGSRYVRTFKELDRKHQVVSSTGKHTNAVLSCLEWMKQNLPEYVKQRREFLNEIEKRIFFRALLQLAHSQETRIEMLEMSDTVKIKMLSSALSTKMRQDQEFTRNIADLVLISMSKNQQHVKAIAANSCKKNR